MAHSVASRHRSILVAFGPKRTLSQIYEYTALTIEVRDSHSHRNRVRLGLAAIGANKYRVLKDRSVALTIGLAPHPLCSRAVCDITSLITHRDE